MHYATEDALSKCRMEDILPIRCKMAASGNSYILRAANGEKRWLFTGNAHTVLANAEWPKYGKNAVLWRNAQPLLAA
jgi:hypothetical protein